MKTARVISALTLTAILGAALTGCSQLGKPPVDKQRAEGAIKSIQNDPHMQPAQKAAMIAEIQKQIQ